MSAFLCDEYLSINYERTDIVCENRFLCQLLSSEVSARPVWSALTCQRFQKRRLVAASLATTDPPGPRQIAASKSGNKLPHSKCVFPRGRLDSGVSKRIISTSAVGR